MRCVSSVRALFRAAPIARRNTESDGASTCSPRSQTRARASSEAVRSSRNASSSRNRASRSPAAVSHVRRPQVLTDALLMFGDRLLPDGVGVDCLGVGPQLQITRDHPDFSPPGGETQGRGPGNGRADRDGPLGAGRRRRSQLAGVGVGDGRRVVRLAVET